MSTIRIIAKNTFLILVTDLFRIFIGFFITMYTAQYLGVSNFGILSFALVISSFISLFCDFGLNTLGVKEIARNRGFESNIIGNIILIKSVLISATIISLLISLYFINLDLLTKKIIFLIGVYAILNTLSGLIASIFQAYEKMEYYSIVNFFVMVVFLLILIYGIKNKFKMIEISSIYVFTGFLSLSLYSFFFLVKKYPFPRLKFNWELIKYLVTLSLPFFLSSIVDTISFRVDIVMLSIIKGNLITGWYSAAYKVFEVFMFIPGAFASAIYPVLSRLFIFSKDSMLFVYEKSTKYLIFISLPITIGVSLFSVEIINYIYKESYLEASYALRIIIWTTPFIFLNFIYGTMLASINQQTIAFKINILCMFSNIILNLILIPKYGFIGTSVSTIITSLISFILCRNILNRLIGKTYYVNIISKPIIAGIVMIISILVFNKFFHTNFLLILIPSFLLYLFTLISLGYFGSDDYAIFRKIFFKAP